MSRRNVWRAAYRPFSRLALFAALFAGATTGFASAPQAAVIDVSVDGSDAIFLAGRTDLLPIPPLPGPFMLARHPLGTPEMILETLPPEIAVTAGDVIRLVDPAIGGISFFNGFGAPLFGPGGNGLSGSNLSSIGGISGYLGPQGPLVGVFLDAAIPSAGPAPATLDFTPGGLGTDFLSLMPELGQVFYIGDGITGGGDFQTFIAPTGATRLFLGIADGFGFVGVPGAYDDNDGSYRVRVGINEIPSLPEPGALAVFGVGLAALGFLRRRAKS